MALTSLTSLNSLTSPFAKVELMVCLILEEKFLLYQYRLSHKDWDIKNTSISSSPADNTS